MHRFKIQAIFALLSNSYFKGFVEGRVFSGYSKLACTPGLNCYSCPGALGSCPMGALQTMLGGRSTNFSFYIVGFLMIIGAACGRFVCGFLCPFGLIQDLLYKIPFFKKIGLLPGDRFLKYLPYFVLVTFVILAPLFLVDFTGMGVDAFCKYICPSGTLGAAWPLVLVNKGIRGAVGFLFAWKSFILIVIIFLSILVYRPFCRYLCPLGAIYGLMNPIAILRFEIDDKKCIKCGKCQEACDWNIATYKTANSPECVRCGKCKSACPTGAISNKQIISNRIKKKEEINIYG